MEIDRTKDNLAKHDEVGCPHGAGSLGEDLAMKWRTCYAREDRLEVGSAMMWLMPAMDDVLTHLINAHSDRWSGYDNEVPRYDWICTPEDFLESIPHGYDWLHAVLFMRELSGTTTKSLVGVMS